MKNIKNKMAILCIICFSLLCFGCQYENNKEQYNEKSVVTEIDYDNYVKEAVDKSIKGTEWNVVLMDLESKEILASYGDINCDFQPGNLIKPILYASLLQNKAVNLKDSVDISYVEYNGMTYRPAENFAQGEEVTVLESFELLNNPAIINIWNSCKRQDKVLEDMSNIGIKLEKDDLTPLLGYKIKANILDIAKWYYELAEEDRESNTPFYMSIDTKKTLNAILKKTFETVSYYYSDNAYYGVFETFTYKENENNIKSANTNFAGYYKKDGKGVVLVVTVKSDIENDMDNVYTSKELVQVILDIFEKCVIVS